MTGATSSTVPLGSQPRWGIRLFPEQNVILPNRILFFKVFCTLHKSLFLDWSRGWGWGDSWLCLLRQVPFWKCEGRESIEGPRPLSHTEPTWLSGKAITSPDNLERKKKITNKVKTKFQTRISSDCNLNSFSLRMGGGESFLHGLTDSKFLNVLLKPWLKSDKNRLRFIIMSRSQSMAPITKQYFITFATFNSCH